MAQSAVAERSLVGLVWSLDLPELLMPGRWGSMELLLPALGVQPLLMREPQMVFLLEAR